LPTTIVEGFEGSFLPSGWSIENPNNDAQWSLSSSAGGYGNSVKSVIFDNYFVQDDITLYVNFGFVEESPTTHLSVGFQFETKNTLIASIINSERNKFQNKKIYLSTEGINHDLMGFLRLHMLDANDLKIANFENDTFFTQFITLGNELRSLQKLKNRLSFLIDIKELEFIENNINNYSLYSPEWSVCKLILNTNELKTTINKYIDDYWASFLG
jgi:hypothetical protein